MYMIYVLYIVCLELLECAHKTAHIYIVYVCILYDIICDGDDDDDDDIFEDYQSTILQIWAMTLIYTIY